MRKKHLEIRETGEKAFKIKTLQYGEETQSKLVLSILYLNTTFLFPHPFPQAMRFYKSMLTHLGMVFLLYKMREMVNASSTFKCV